MIWAEVSSGRSDFDSSSPTKREMPGIGRRGRVLDRRRAALARRLEGRGAHRDDLLGVGRLHGLDRVAGIDRPLERVGRHHLDDVGDLHHVEQRRDARHDVLAGRGRGRDDRVVGPGERDDQRRQRLGQRVLVGRRLGEQHLVDAVELGGRVRDRLRALAGDQHMHVAAHRLRGGQRLGGRVLQRLVVVLGDQERGHQSTPASFLSLSTSSADGPDLDAGLAAGRLDGLQHFEPRRDVDAVVAGRLLVDRLLLRLHDVRQRRVARLVEAQIGGDDRRDLQLHGLQAAVDLARHAGCSSPSIATFEAKVPCGQPSSAASIWPVWLQSSSIACLPMMTRPGFSSSTIALRIFATASGSTDAVDLDQDAAVGAHRERGADRLGRLLRPDRDGDDLGRLAFFLQPDRLLDGDLVEGVHRHLDVGELDARAVGLHADLDVVIDHPLDGHQNLHASKLLAPARRAN